MIPSLPVVYLVVGGVVTAAVLIFLIVRNQSGPECSADLLGLHASLEGEPWWERAAAARRMSIDNNICRVCQKPTTTQCSSCKSVKYCGPVCQRKDWSSSHKFECPNFKARRQLEAKAAAAGNSKPPFLDPNEDAPVPQQVLFPYELFMQLRKSPSSCRRAPVGLVNHGNNCYANAALQCLLYTKPLRAFLDQGLHNKGCNKPHDRDWCLLCVLTRLCQEVSDAPLHAEMSLKPLLRHLRRFAKTMSYGRQEDAHEFFYSVLNTMEAIMLTNFGGKDRFDMRTQETTLVHHVFGGYLRSQVVCCSCGAASRRYEAALDLQLEVPAGVDRLEDVLQRHTADEVLDGDNCYACDGCKQRCRATRSTRFEVAPNTLVLCLKRFGTGRFSKINKILVYGEKLDLGPFMAQGAMDDAPTTYTLTGVVVHLDQMNSTSFGHYVSFVRSWEGSGSSNGSSGQWYACDDGRVCRCRAADVLAQNAYMLFYQRDFPKPAPRPGYTRPKPLLPLTAAQQAAAAAAEAAAAAAAAAQHRVSDTQRMDQKLHEQEPAAAAAAGEGLQQQQTVPEAPSQQQEQQQDQQQRLAAMQSSPAPEQQDASAELLPRIATAPAALGLLATRVDSSSRDEEETGSHATSSSCLADVSGCSTPSYQANGSAANGSTAAAAAASDAWAFGNGNTSSSRGPSRLSSEHPAAGAAEGPAAAAKLPAHTLLRRRKQQQQQQQQQQHANPPPAGPEAHTHAAAAAQTGSDGSSEASGDSSSSSAALPRMRYRVEAAGPELLRVSVELPGVTSANQVAVAVESFGRVGCQQQSLWLRVPGRFAELQLQLDEHLQPGQSVGAVSGKLYRAKQRLKLKLQLVEAAAAAAGAAGGSSSSNSQGGGRGIEEAAASGGGLVVDYHLTDSFDTSSSGSESEGYNKPARRGMHAIASERDLCSIFGRHSSQVAQQLLQQLQQQRQGAAAGGEEGQEGSGDAAEGVAEGAGGAGSKKPAKKKAGSSKKKKRK